ncbi:class I glutamine amidotransferase-like protein [Delitschia confertaspora ATCC 74209]|uniref:Class I glutamine amidotransferase-like protein n=1 Tax=Delitschia confertaspora ATCC 74209 TaxID=1513339 RepID=A0A9P4MTK6_9PLEO|nr:class I glutamine amidotransferase-like protein [Delitschia confertaspora ATCC 74209]
MVFNGYTLLDFWGPMSILTSLSATYNMSLSIIADKVGPVTSASVPHTMPDGSIVSTDNQIVSTVIATHSPQNAPPLDLLFVPGGFGSWNMGAEPWMEDFIKARFNDTDYIASVCSGSMTLARAGVLNEKRATTNKWGWAWLTEKKHGENVIWVPSARWVQDGKIWTSSGVAAGMDMTYALLSWMYGSEKVGDMMNTMELAPHTNEHWDPYSVVHKVPGADTSRSLKELVGPVGYN